MNMKLIASLMCVYFVLGASACGDVNYKPQTTTGANSPIDNNDNDGSVIVTASDQADVNANQGSDTTDTNNEEIGGIPLQEVDNIETVGVQTDVCAGPPALSAETCAARTADLSSK